MNNILPTWSDSLANTTNILQSEMENLQNTPFVSTPDRPTLGSIVVNVLSYDKNKNLVGNPHASDLGTTDDVPTLLEDNIKQYLNNFRILTDEVFIQDGYIVNFGVFFDVTAHKHTNKQEVKLRCIQKVKDYFNIDKMQFNQIIYTSEVEYELMNVEGVRQVNYVTLTQKADYNDSGGQEFSEDLYNYSMFDGTPASDGTEGYGYYYDFSRFYDWPEHTSVAGHGVILPPLQSGTPGVFELKNPNRNIRGRVR